VPKAFPLAVVMGQESMVVDRHGEFFGQEPPQLIREHVQHGA